MTLKDLKLNNENYMHKAFDPEQREKLLRSARTRRTIYLVTTFSGVACVAYAFVRDLPLISCLALMMAIFSIVVVTKYDTQVFFLTVIEHRQQDPGEVSESHAPDHSRP